MWTTIHVATSAEEARIITELLDSHNITYELEAGPVSGTVEILVQEGDLQAAKALLKDEPSPTTGPLQAPHQSFSVCAVQYRCAALASGLPVSWM